MAFLPSGRGDGIPRIEVARPNEQPVGTADPKPKGKALGRPPYPAGSPEAREAGRRGGKKRAGQTRLASRLGLRSLPSGNAFGPYKASAVSFRLAQCAQLASSVGGGYCGPAPSSFVASAALQLAWSRYLSDIAAETGNGELAIQASRLANDSRQNLLAAHEMCAREADARRDANPQNPHVGLVRAIRGDS